MINSRLQFVENLANEVRRLILTEREHIGGRSKEVHTMNLLFGAFFDKNNPLNDNHRNIMKALQGFEMQTLIVDKAIDKPDEIKDWDMRIIVGFILQSAMTKQFNLSLKKLSLPYEDQLMAINVWNETLRHIYIGEGLDVIYTKKQIQPLNFDEYLFMIKESTAKFIQLSLILGALISKKGQIEKIKNYGINLGIAFQIRDDFYDFENDIKEGKQRIFVIKEALQELNPEERKFIMENYKKKPEKIIKIILASNISTYVKGMNNYYIDKAIQSLETIDEKYKICLKDIAETLRV